MFKEFMVVLLIGHLLGDFYFQTNQIANGKETSLPSLCYALPLLLDCDVTYLCSGILLENHTRGNCCLRDTPFHRHNEIRICIFNKEKVYLERSKWNCLSA